MAAWCSNYEFEDVISSVEAPAVETFHAGSAYESRQWMVRRLIWRPGVRALAARMNPGLKPIRLTQDYDVLVYVCMNPSDLLYLNAIEGWRDRCRTKLCYMVEFYSGWLKEYEFHLTQYLTGFDQVYLSFSGSVPSVHQAVGKPVHHVPLGADLFRFTPYPTPPQRGIDVYSMGRRSEMGHQAFLKQLRKGELFYIYDTIPGLFIQPKNHLEHRDLIANCAKRARYFITYPAKVDVAEETRGQSEAGARFFEGAAAGSILLGQAPTVPAFARDFSWPGAVLNIGGSEEELMATLDHWNRRPEQAAALRRQNACTALRSFDWGHRWAEMLRLAGLPATPQLQEREARLSKLAALAESTPLTA